MNISELQNVLKESKIENDKLIISKNLHDTILSIKDNYNFDILKSITGIDCGNNIELIYHLYSVPNQEDLLISTYVTDSAETVSDIFESAKADENEIYDMFGVQFDGNADLKRLYMPEGWNGHPLRKDYTGNDTRLAWNDENNA